MVSLAAQRTRSRTAHAFGFGLSLAMLSAPIKVLMTADTVGGVWTYALGLCRGLAARGGRVTLVSFGEPASEAQRAEVAEVAGITLVETRYKLEWMPDPWSDVDEAGRFLQGLARAEEPDVVHLNGYAHAALPWPVAVQAMNWAASLGSLAAPRSGPVMRVKVFMFFIQALGSPFTSSRVMPGTS